MPLKAFSSDGTGYTSDILRASYWAVQNGANIINMSFNLPGYSLEMKMAMDYATLNGVICVAAAGNQGVTTATYPAAYANVIGVASTTNDDQRSSFSNYGNWEGVVTTYPFSTYAAGWGTSFSAPLVSGAAALMLDYSGSLLMDILVSNDESDCAKAVAHAKATNPQLGHGVLNAHRAVKSWRETMGKP
jgi:subtilisin family serine protease